MIREEDVLLERKGVIVLLEEGVMFLENLEDRSSGEESEKGELMECVFDEVVKGDEESRTGEEAAAGVVPAASRNLSLNEEKNFDSFSRSVKLTDVVMRRLLSSVDFFFAVELRFSG